MNSDLFGKTEPLCAELQRHLVDYGNMMALKHPLIFDVPYFEPLNARLNQMLKIKKQRAAAAKKNGEFGQFIFLHERPYRVNAFLKIAKLIKTDEQWWSLVRDLWIDSENIHEWGSKNILFIFQRKNSHLMMSEEEALMLKKMPDILTIYRGVSHDYDNNNGWSWTCDKQKALWFANRWKTTDAKLFQGKVAKKDILAHLLGRNEQEIIVDPQKIKNIKKTLTINNNSIGV